MLANVENKIEDSFERLLKTAELSFIDFSTVSRCQADIEKHLLHSIPAFASVLSGSISRHTMVPTLSSNIVDLLILFNHKYKTSFLPSVLLEKLRTLLLDDYDETVLQQTTMSLVVPVESFEFRLQPGFITEHNHYMIPAPGWDDWVEYDVIGYKHQLAKSNAGHAGKLVPVIRLMKVWNKLNGNTFDGYYLELIVKDSLDGYEIENYAATLNHVFKSIVKLLVYKKDDPANTGLQVEGLRDVEHLVEAMLQVHDTYKLTQQAMAYEEQGDIKLAYALWQKMFPDYYPQYTE